jgi:hypothetical protein
MNTVLAIIAITGSVVSANIPEKPHWQPSYRDAYLSATQNGKPLAVFIGGGSAALESGFDAKAHLLLKQKYVYVYIDAMTEAGQSLAKSFAVNGKGLVISDKAGRSQAFHHSGELSKELLVKALERYADKEVTATESAAHLQPKPALQINSSCPSCQYQSSCPGGNCPRR